MKKITLVITAATIAAAALTPLAARIATDQPATEGISHRAAAGSEDDEPLEPNGVSDLSVVWKPSQNGFLISFKAPTQGSSYDWTNWDYIYGELTSISRIDVALVGGQVLKTFDNPTPGQKLSYIETSLQRGQTYSFAVTVYCDDLYSDAVRAYNVLAGSVPACPDDIRVTSQQGAAPFTLTFTAPTLCSDGETPLTQIVKGELWTKGGGWVDPDFIATLPDMTPGQKVEYVIDSSRLSGEQNWTLTLFSTDGPSEKAPVQFYIGTDTPGMVANLHTTEQPDGSILISWEAPETGSRGGWYDPTQLKYDVSLLTPGNWGDDRTDLASGLTATSYTFAPNFTTPTNIRFAVYPKTDMGFGTPTFTSYMIIGPALSLPFTETFDNRVTEWSYDFDHLWAKSTTCTENYPPEWKVSNYCYVGNTQVYPPADEGGLVYINPYSYTPESDFMLTSSKIDISGSSQLTLIYKFYAPGIPSGNTSVSASVSFDGGSTFSQVHRALLSDTPTEGWVTATTDIPVPTDASSVVLRFTGHNSPEAIAILIDDILLRAGEQMPDVYPASVSDFTAALLPDYSGIKVELTAPTLSHASLGEINGQPLTTISRIVLQRRIGYTDYAQIHEFVNPTPGEALSFVDTDIAQGGEYYYRAIVYINNLCDFGNYTDYPVTLGQTPAEVTELTMTSNRGAAPVTVSFRLPETDNQGLPLRSITSVNILRYNMDSYTWETVGTVTEGLTPGELASWNDTRVVVGETYEYRVVCVGTAGSSYGVTDYVYVGMDEPERPSNLIASIGNDGEVYLTWEAPTTGINHGYIDTQHLFYTIQRGNGYSDFNADFLDTEIVDTEYIDHTQFDEEEIVKYFVKATSGQYTGYSAISNLLIVGKPAQLPFTESFNKVVAGEIQPSHTTWVATSTESASNWAFAEMAYFLMEGQIKPVDSDEGLAYSFYGPYATIHREDYLTSGNLDVLGLEKAELSYHFYAVSGYDTGLRVEIAFDGGDFSEVKLHDYNNLAGADGWTKVTLPIDVPQGAATMQMRFAAIKGDSACSVALDNIRVSKDSDGVESVQPLDAVMVASIGANIVVSGLQADEDLRIYDVNGRNVYVGKGDATVALPAGIYLVNLRNNTLKLSH